MKKIIFLISSLLIVATSFAHLINPASGNNACSKSGYIEVNGTLFDYTGTNLDYAHFYITKTGNGNVTLLNPIVWDTTITITSSSLTFYVKQVSSPENVFIEEYTRSSVSKPYTLQYHNFGSNGDIDTSPGYGVITSTCIATPIILTDWSAVLNNGIVTFSWTSMIEFNNSHYTIEGSSDSGKTWDQVDTVNSYWPNGTSPTPHTYTKTYNDFFVIEAGMGLGLLIYLIFAGLCLWLVPKLMIKFDKWFMLLAVIVSLAVTSCHKISLHTTTGVKYTWFQLSQTDLDGTVTTYQTRTVK